MSRAHFTPPKFLMALIALVVAFLAFLAPFSRVNPVLLSAGTLSLAALLVLTLLVADVVGVGR